MESQYELPNGDKLWVIDTATAAQYLGRALQIWREGGTEPIFFGNTPRPEGVVISFDQWSEYEELKEEAAFDRRMEQITRDRLTNTRPEDWVSFEQAAREDGWDLDAAAPIADADPSAGERGRDR